MLLLIDSTTVVRGSMILSVHELLVLVVLVYSLGSVVYRQRALVFSLLKDTSGRKPLPQLAVLIFLFFNYETLHCVAGNLILL